MKLSLSCGLAGMFLVSAAAFAQSEKPAVADAAAATMTVDTPTFTTTVMSSDQFEILSSEMAKTKAPDADVKAFADHMIKDHTMAGAKLRKVMQDANMGPSDKPPVAPKHQKMLDQLQAAAAGPGFETLYIDMQAQGHMEAVSLFRTYAGSGDNQALVGFATETLPTLEMHLAEVKKLVAAH